MDWEYMVLSGGGLLLAVAIFTFVIWLGCRD
jgi:hypothetical protein